jgi:hypothetical protein
VGTEDDENTEDKVDEVAEKDVVKEEKDEVDEVDEVVAEGEVGGRGGGKPLAGTRRQLGGRSIRTGPQGRGASPSVFSYLPSPLDPRPSPHPAQPPNPPYYALHPDTFTF